MKVFFVQDDLFAPAASPWLNIFWPSYHALCDVADTVFVPRPAAHSRGKTKLEKLSKRMRFHRESRAVCESVTKQLHSSGPNVLLVFALNYADIAWTKLLHPVWDAFSHTVLCLYDNFDVTLMNAEVVQQFDLITSNCGDLCSLVEHHFSKPVLFLPSDVDALNYVSYSNYRPIDLLVVGRRDHDLHSLLHRHFNARGGKRTFIDFVTRTQTPITCEHEFDLLMSTYSRSSVALCFDGSGVGRFFGRSPMTARWIHAWASGCTVMGSSPKGRGVEALLDWPESIIEFPSDKSHVVEFTESVLNDKAGLLRRRRRNVAEVLMRHDTRYRYRDIFQKLELPLTEKLSERIDQLQIKANTIISGEVC